MTVGLTLYKPWIVVLAEALQAGNVNPYSEYVSVYGKMNCCFLQDRRCPKSLPEGLVGLLEGWCCTGDSASLSAAGVLGIWQ